MPGAAKAWRPVYRQLIREAKNLPDETASLHYRKEAKRTLKLKRETLYDAHQLLRQLRLANAGYLSPLQDCLATAYGRIGHRADSRIQSLLEEARSEDIPPLIPGVPHTRPPVYTDRLKAYLTSPVSLRTGKASTEAQLSWPPTLPERAKPESEEARLLGPFSKRREANIRWRYLRAIQKRLYPPFKAEEVEKLETLAVTPAEVPEAKSKQVQLDKQASHGIKGDRPKHRPKHITPRFLRRRYQEILHFGPILSEEKKEEGVQWKVARPGGAKELGTRPVLSEEDRRWLIGKL